MHEVEPKVFLVGEMRGIKEGLSDYLEVVGAADWASDAPSDIEELTEVMSRICYRSFKPGLNPNVTKVRKSNKDHLSHIIEVKHGSVTEHSFINFIFFNVSRVFTHELVRHRVGVAVSQESMRFVRLVDIGVWLPRWVTEDKRAYKIFKIVFEKIEWGQRELAKHWKIDTLPFDEKKKKTSAMRRAIPIGVATTIGWSANIRTIRWVLEARTDPAAEEEIRLVFGKVAETVIERYPNLFFDFEKKMADGLPWYKPKYSKV